MPVLYVHITLNCLPSTGEVRQGDWNRCHGRRAIPTKDLKAWLRLWFGNRLEKVEMSNEKVEMSTRRSRCQRMIGWNNSNPITRCFFYVTSIVTYRLDTQAGIANDVMLRSKLEGHVHRPLGCKVRHLIITFKYNSKKVVAHSCIKTKA